jgi:hypothetical protein
VPLTLLDYDRARERARYVVAEGHDGAGADIPPAAAGF